MPVDPLALSRERPEWSAQVPVTPRQKAQMVVGCVVLLGLVLWQPWHTARLFVLLCTVFYLLFSGYKLLLARFSIRRGAQLSVTPAEVAALGAADLPVYSVLVPLYREKESVRHLVAALRALDYPPEKKDVQLLVEEDDSDTRDAIAAIELPPEFRVTVVPVSQPRTKPKACNYGLAEARGELLVIYDAEDRPEPDQLRKAVVAFSRVGPKVACLQSRLNFYNPRFNLLTRWFTAEYSAWFDLSLPGLAAVGGIIPLGGTSNHFRTAVLRELYGWDAFNVAEDCDLGIRIYRAGYTTSMLETTTWEEACSRLPSWIRQRTRWVKGYIQTYLVHMRRPRRLLRELGLRGFLHFQLLIGGTVVSLFLNPLYWFLVTLWFLFRLEVLTSLFPGLVFALGALCLFVGNFAFVYLGAVGVHRRGYYDLVRAALISPVYWVMMSYSGWRAFFQFFADPFRWEKTQHGVSDTTQPGE